MAVFDSCCRCQPLHACYELQLSEVLRRINQPLSVVLSDMDLDLAIQQIVCLTILIVYLKNVLSLGVPFLLEAVSQFLFECVVV